MRPLHVCGEPSCPVLTRTRRCEAHEQVQRTAQDQATDRQRGTPAERGYDARWRKARLAYLHQHPLCVQCRGEGRTAAATVVDHITPHRGDVALFWDAMGNWQGLCVSHHNAKSATERMDHHGR